ncbi:outer membrane usher protein FimD [Vibrio sp. JCM 19052]|nr:outer membrane usher protein FimD [Vibrio sp. JCM 19052]
MNLDIPQAAMVNKPRGYIDSEKWDEGMTALFIKHNTNYYHNEYDRLEDSDYLYSNLKVGMNLAYGNFAMMVTSVISRMKRNTPR